MMIARTSQSDAYPRTLKRDVGGPTPELTYLARYFNTCEINATFYRQFEPEIAKRWSEGVENPDFEFAIKANQVFTHAEYEMMAGK